MIIRKITPDSGELHLLFSIKCPFFVPCKSNLSSIRRIISYMR